IRFRGIAVGEVEQVVLAPNLKGVLVQARLRPDALGLARDGTTFWIVRPQASLYGIQGLETLIGANYIGVLPGTGAPKFVFAGSEEQLAGDHAGDLFEIVLEAPTCANLRPGMPIKYKKFNIGRLLAIRMKHDLTGFRIRAAIEPAYQSLIRERTVFWNSSGLNFSFTLRGGIQLDVDSLQSILAGGLTIGIPDDPGQPVPVGHLFSLLEMPPSGWESWNPPITLTAAGTP
ncbi:MAG TPA: MlaD family protein, partial [Candidatus Ozemobacteraceae bacterium]|nr:MlaD family protein [Candidatus Ozemobacteraceae bacterium]